MSISTCQTCSSELTPISLRSAYTPPCCQSPICSRCTSLNPRLKEYTPCLRCGDPKRADLRGAINDRSIPSRRVERQSTSGAGDIVSGGQVVFAIGDDEEDEGDLPPAYEANLAGSVNENLHSGPPAGSFNLQNVSPTTDITRDADSELYTAIENNENDSDIETEAEVVEVRHSLKKGETLLAIARKYAADPHEILILNNLPHTVLTSHPHLLRTRSSLLISRRQVPRSRMTFRHNLPNSPVETNDDDDDDKQREIARERERQVKRFQLLTKNVDPGVGKAYLALEEMTESQHPLEYSSGEQIATESEERGTGKKVLTTAGSASGNVDRENRALERYWQDEEWEREYGGPPPSDQYKKGALSKLGSANNKQQNQGTSTSTSTRKGQGTSTSTSTSISSWMGIPIKS